MTSPFASLEFLLKKFIGTPDGYPGTNYAAESSGIARQRIIPDIQVFSQTIPSTAPIDMGLDNTFVPTKGSGTRSVSTKYYYIAKYTLELQDYQTQYVTYRYDNPTSSGVNLNLLSNAIPFNYDPFDLTYDYTMTFTNTSIVLRKNDDTYPWIFDTDSGYVYFILNKIPAEYGNPVLTFWRYEGNFGATIPDILKQFDT